MNVLAPVSSIMTKDLKTVSPDTSLLEIRDFFKDHRIHHLPVVEFRKIVGIISKEDFLSFSLGCMGERELKSDQVNELSKWKAKQIMTDKLAKLEADDPIRTALEVFKLNRLHALPIVAGEELIGILTPHDIIKALADATIPLTDYQRAK